MQQGFGHSGGFDSVFKNSLNEAMANGRWQEVVAGLGADVAESVRLSLANIQQLVATRRIEPTEARWLQAPLRRLYQVGLAAQRLSRLADHPRSGATEPVRIDDVVAEAVTHHQHRSRSHRIAVELAPLEVVAQPEMLAAAVDSLFLWSMKIGRVISLRVIRPVGSGSGELWLRIEELHKGALEDRNLNSVDWHVLWQLARLKGVKVRRKVSEGNVRVQVSFTRVMQQHAGMAILEQGLDDDGPAFDALHTSVWCLLPRSHLSAVVVQTLKPHLPRIEVAPELRELVHDGREPPDCIVSNAEIIETDEFKRWRRKSQERMGRTIAVVEITPDANVFDIGGLGSRSVARLSADSVSSKLLSALVFELSQLHSAPH